MDGGAHFVGVSDAAGAWGDDFSGLQQGNDLRTTGAVAEADEGEGGVATDHRRRILEHLEECFVESGDGGVLTHDPGVRVAYFFNGMGGQANHFRVPPYGVRILMAHAL